MVTLKQILFRFLTKLYIAHLWLYILIKTIQVYFIDIAKKKNLYYD
jgi:hypothetical protein